MVTVWNVTVQARFWYDGRNLHQAKEDAAEEALNRMQRHNNLLIGRQ